MKKIFPFLVFLTLTFATSSQTYHPLIESGKTWNVLTVTMTDWFTSTYMLDGDTLIAGTTYQKLYEKSSFNTAPVYLGGIREQSSDQKVFFYDHNADGEGLLYDFSLEAGDTVAIQSNMGWKGYPLTFRVDSVDQVIDESGVSRKRMLLSYHSFIKYSGEEWIEGIGSMQGLISPGNFFYIADLNWESLCTKLDGNVVFYNPLFDTCYIEYVGIPKVSSDPPVISISPNPVSDISVIQIINTLNDGYVLEIYDLYGRLLQKESLTSNRAFIYNQDYSQGIYFLKVAGPNHEIATGKFVIK